MTKDQLDALANEQARGRMALEVLNSPVFIQAWEEAAKALSNQRRKCGVKDTELAVKLIMAEQTLGIVKSYIENLINGGKLAEQQLKLEGERATWLKRMTSGGFSRL